ncbi:MAG: aminopeptidase [Candidatus Hodarchaeales archaeon]|jgi:leucyl aminopeptidase (aminopeptidase T)
MEPVTSAKNALDCVLEALPGENIIIICDEEKVDVGKVFAAGAVELGLWTRMIVFKPGENEIRTVVPDTALQVIMREKPDICINLLRENVKETPFRVALITYETRNKRVRLGHCPDITIDMLSEGALALSKEEQVNLQHKARLLLAKLKDVVEVEVTSSAGTGLIFRVDGRDFFTDTQINWEDLHWMNLPTGEVTCAPVEKSLEGLLVCDVAVGGIGQVDKEIHLNVKDGKVIKIHCADKKVEKIISDALATDEKASYVGEFAFGLNPKARLVPQFLETEKLPNTVHLAFGHNLDFPGGENDSSNHMDFLIDKPTVTVIYKNDRVYTIMKEGKLDL